MAPPGRDPQFVLEHSGFVAKLVRRLVFDPELARDVEQETWLAALKHEGPARGSERSWLATIARNLARRAWRTKARREERELDPPPQPSTPTPAEILEREALRREVVEALLALDEPWRETLVLHFLEELPSQTIAERLGVPLETVRTRIKRGLELLRARLERRTHLHGAALSLALVEAWRLSPPPFAAFAASVSSLSIGAVLMSTATKSFVAAAAVLALVFAYRFTSDSEPATPNDAVAALEPQEALAAPREQAAEENADATARTELAPQAAPAAASAPASASTLCTVILRAKWEHDGAPANGIGFDMHSSNARDFYRDAARHWTGEDGSVRIENVPPGRVTFYSERGSFAQGEAKAGETIEVELTMPQGFLLKGRVLDVDRTPMAGASVYLWQCFNDADEGWVVARSDERGEYQVRGLSTMLNFISARAPGRAPTLQRLVMSNTGAVVEVDLVFEAAGGALRGRVIDPDGTPLAGAVVVVGGYAEDGSSVRMPDGAEARAAAGQRVRTDAEGWFEVDGLPAGDIPVRARGGDFAPWRGSVAIDVGRRSPLEIRLTRGGRITGVVRNDAGEPVARAEVKLGQIGNFESAHRRTAPDGTFEIGGISGGESKLEVEHDKFGSASMPVTVVEGATQHVEFRLDRGLTLRVRIGGNVADWIGGHVQATADAMQKGEYYNSLQVGADGFVEFTQCPDIPLKLLLFAPNDFMFPRATLEGVLASAGEVWLHPDPAKIGSVRLKGRIVDVDGNPVGSARLMPSTEGYPMSPIESCDSATGRFELGSYAPGKWMVRAEAIGFVTGRTEFVSVASGTTHDFGDIVMQREARVRVFGLRQTPETRAAFVDGAGGLQEFAPAGTEWLSPPLEEGRGWVVTGGGQVALVAQQVEIHAGETLDVRAVEQLVVPRRLRPAASLAAEFSYLGVFDANGVSLGAFGAGEQGGDVRVPLATGRYELRLFSNSGELGRRTIEVTDERGDEPIELALD
ncbi:MAG: sigma-70 family RNA polymerase sigma factor [Planctomycetota bacterium]|nr:sigma-70 family RNA polymerase sigma factor [Planctomycetota bacterium]